MLPQPLEISRELRLLLHDLRRFRVMRVSVCVARRLYVIVSTREDEWWSSFRFWAGFERFEDAAIARVYDACGGSRAPCGTCPRSLELFLL